MSIACRYSKFGTDHGRCVSVFAIPASSPLQQWQLPGSLTVTS